MQTFETIDKRRSIRVHKDQPVVRTCILQPILISEIM